MLNGWLSTAMRIVTKSQLVGFKNYRVMYEQTGTCTCTYNLCVELYQRNIHVGTLFASFCVLQNLVHVMCNACIFNKCRMKMATSHYTCVPTGWYEYANITFIGFALVASRVLLVTF